MPTKEAASGFVLILAGLARESGLGQPVQPRSSYWLLDRHTVMAALAAAPILAGLWWFDIVSRMTPPDGWRAWVTFILIAPFAEELVFRGVIQGQIAGLLNEFIHSTRATFVSKANILTTGLFVVAHLSAQPVLWALAVAAPSLVLGHLRERFDSIWPAILIHALYNLGFGLLAFSVLPDQ
ncbi:MAG: JDVT-CTERM system glutamic-type intramembrane protease MrtJ [Burkholderiaceae bacterium]